MSLNSFPSRVGRRATKNINIVKSVEYNSHNSIINNDCNNDVINVDSDDSDAAVAVAEAYVSHPVNAFHLMKRTSHWMPKIKNHFGKSGATNTTDEVPLQHLRISITIKGLSIRTVVSVFCI